MSTSPASALWQRARNSVRRALSSLRWRLVGVFAALGVAVSVLFALSSDQAIEKGWTVLARPLLGDYVQRLTLDLGSPPSIERATALVTDLPITLTIKGPLVNWSSSAALPNYAAEQATARRFGKGDWGGADRFWEATTSDGHNVVFGLNMQLLRNSGPDGFPTLALLLGVVALAGWWIGRMLRPIDLIGAGAMRFGQGDFNTPIALTSKTGRELRELADTVNTMGRDIEAMLEGKRALLLAISHELRSPLTRARLNTELLDDSGNSATTREALIRDLAEMNQLITTLLDSERLQAGHEALHLQTTDLYALAGEVCASFHAARLLPCAQTVVVQVDSTRMRLLLHNLLANAQRHASDAVNPTEVEVGYNATTKAWRLRVRDFGPGVPEQYVDKLTDAFYRPDDARTRHSGGVGLGLYLCATIAKAHGAHLDIRNAKPGLEVDIVGSANA